MNGHVNGNHLDIRQRSHSMISPANSVKHCSCKHLPGLVNNCKMIGIMTPRYALGTEILQASLTIIPAAAHADLRGSSFRYNDHGGCHSQPALPNRHSKSLDQLEQHSTPNIRTIQEAELMYTSTSGAAFLEHSLQDNRILGSAVSNPKKVNSADLLRNINEFKMKYKNPGTFGGSTSTSTGNQEISCYVPPEVKSESERSTGIMSGRGVKNMPLQKLPNGDLHWNSLPKTTSGRQKKYTKHCKSGSGSFSTLPKSKSTQNINKLHTSQHSFRYSRVRITDYKRSISRNGRKRGGSRGSVNRSQSEINTSSTDSDDNQVYEKCKMPRAKKKILASVSVPFQLENYNRKDEFSESLPNLAPPPAGFRNQDTNTMINSNKPTTKASSASLTSPMSEESGDVSSEATSPRFVKSESLRINGEKMRKKLEQLALTTSSVIGKPKRPGRKGKTKSEKSKSEFDLPSMNDGVAIADIKLVPPEEFRDSVFTPLPPAEFRDTQIIAEEKKVQPIQKKIEKTTFIFEKPVPPVKLRSNGSLYSVRSGDYDNFPRIENGNGVNGTINGEEHIYTHNNSFKKRGSHLSLNALDQHRNSVNHILATTITTTTTTTKIVKHMGSCQAFDNPIYHMCELSRPIFNTDIPQCNGVTSRRGSTKIMKSQSTNQLFDATGRTSSSSHGSGNCCSRNSSPREIHKTIEVKKGDMNGEEDEKTERLQEPPLLEFEKCREEFRKQVNYTGAIYSDFSKLASELPYFYINDELRAFSPNGLHLIVCVHGK